jgi:WhiB family redox-sensing transcriptional regulator
VTDDWHWHWRRFAACGGLDVEIFYHPDGERGHRKNARITQAKKICRACPVLNDCATWALTTLEPYGIWGGMSEDERADILGVRSLKYPALAPGRRPD